MSDDGGTATGFPAESGRDVVPGTPGEVLDRADGWGKVSS